MIPKAKLLVESLGGLQISHVLVKGGNYHYMVTNNEEKKKYWTTKARLEAATVQMQKFLDIKMRKSTFKKVSASTFYGILLSKMTAFRTKSFQYLPCSKCLINWALPDSLKHKKAFPEINDHVLDFFAFNSMNYDEVAKEAIRIF
jgi:hypothetical protein